MGRSYYTPEGIDDADLEAELAGLEDELDGDELAVGESQPVYLQPASMPVQPSSDVPAAQRRVAMDENGLPL